MKLSSTVAVSVTALALGATTAAFAGSTTPSNPGTAHMPTTTQAPSTVPPSNQGTANRPSTPGPNAGLPAKAKAYGRYCQGESRKHVAGTPGTPFSACVTAMAKVSHDQASPRSACKTESRKHVAGQHGTPFSLCVSGAAKLKHDQHSSNA